MIIDIYRRPPGPVLSVRKLVITLKTGPAQLPDPFSEATTYT